MKGVEGFKARLGANIQESMGGGSTGGAGGPLPGVAHGVPGRYDGVTRPKDALTIPVEKLRADPDQPRKEFDPAELEQLAESLRTRGQLQPIRVRFVEPGGWLIVSGERRWRAARMAGLVSLMAVEAKGSPAPEDLLEDQLVENCVRADLKPVEQARSFRALMDRRGYSGRQLAERLSLSHSQVQRALALLELPETVQESVERGELAASAAVQVAKLPAEVRETVARAAMAEGLSRDELVEMAAAVKARAAGGPPGARPEAVTLDVGDAVVTVRWKRGGPSASLAQVLRKALKAAASRDDRAA